MNLCEFFDGKKTHLAGIGIILATAAYVMGYVTLDQYVALQGAFGGGGLMALRAGVEKTKEVQ